MWVTGALMVSGVALGLASLPHCALMCATPCAAVAPHARGQIVFQGLRLVSYALAGALAAGVAGALAQAQAFSPVLRPVWTLLHTALLALGLWLLVTARLPAWMGLQGVGARALRLGPTSGALWALWPCGMLQAALLIAAMADHPAGGALVMATFAAVTSPALVWAPLLLKKFRAMRDGRIAIRLAGATLTMAALGALGHGLWVRFLQWCGQAS